MMAALLGNMDAMRMLLDHPSADAAAMLMHACHDEYDEGHTWTEGYTSLMLAAERGNDDVIAARPPVC
jgi:ankyrin repeat protein